MMIACWIVCVSLNAPFFDVQDIPIPHPGAQCFVAAADNDGVADLFVLDGRQVTVYEDAKSVATRKITLLPETSAFDVADLDGDGISELVTICGNWLIRYDLDSAASDAPIEMFQRETQLSVKEGTPFLHVLVVRREGTPLLALPCEATFELRSVTGELVAEHPIGMNAPRHVMYGRPFSSWTVDPPLVGEPGSLEFRVSQMRAVEPSLPPDLLPVAVEGPMIRSATPRQARDAATLKPDAWPWFPLRADGSGRERALYALGGNGLGDTLIRVQRPAGSTDGTSGEVRIGPRRSYPGVLVIPEDDLPDFNGDGYTDLFLWNAPEPAPTVDTLSRALVERRWPLWITAHLYAPTKERFEPKPATRLSLEIPVEWFLTATGAAPAHFLVLRDLDGDKTTDFACSLAPKQYAVWRWTKNGFPDTPDFQHVFSEIITGVELRADLEGRGRTSIILRGETKWFVLKAAGDFVPVPSPAQSAASTQERPPEPAKP